MLAAEVSRDPSCVGRLVEIRVAWKRDVECRNSSAQHAGCHRHHGTGVEPPAEKCAERNVADQPQRHRVPEQVLQPVNGPGKVSWRGRRLGGPVAPDCQPTGFPDPQMPRWQASDLQQRCPIPRHPAPHAECSAGVPVHRPVAPGQAHQAPELRREGDAVLADRVVQRLLTDPIAGEQQSTPASIPQRKGEHAIHIRQEAVSPGFVPVYGYLNVRATGEAVS